MAEMITLKLPDNSNFEVQAGILVDDLIDKILPQKKRK